MSDQPRMYSGLLYHRATLAKSAATKVNRLILAVNATGTRRLRLPPVTLPLPLPRWSEEAAEGKNLLLFWLPNVRLQVLVIAPHGSHEAYVTLFLYCADPALLMNVAPSG